MTRPLTIREAAGRVLRRPIPWVLRYLGAVVPALLVAALLVVPLRGWLSHPLVAEAFETRSLDLLVDALMDLAEGLDGGPVLLAGLVLTPIVWGGLQLVWLFLEGGVLATYALPDHPTARQFLQACITYTASFLLIGVATSLVTGVVVVAGVAGVAAAGALLPWQWPGIVVGALTALGVIAVHTVAQQTRAAAVVAGDRNVRTALRCAGRIFRRRFAPLAILTAGTLATRALLAILASTLSGWIPLSWWLLTLLVQQSLQIAVTGVGLVRRAGQVAIASSSEVPLSATDIGA